jgi:hypothetical protein
MELRSETMANTIRADAKLPDDLVLEEFADIVGALQTMVGAALEWATAPNMENAGGHVAKPEPPQLIRVQYGSDFLVILGLVATSAASLAVIFKCFNSLVTGISTVADIRLKSAQRHQVDADTRRIEAETRRLDEEGLKLKDERLRALQERKRAVATVATQSGPRSDADASTVRANRRMALDEILPLEARRELALAVDQPLTATQYAAVATLTDYNVTIHVEEVP